MSLGFTPKLHKLSDNRFIIEITKSFSAKFACCLESGIFIEIIVAAKIIFIQQKINLAAPLAAKILLSFCNDSFAIISTMKAAI